jgi:hypothetical protein
MDTNTSEDFTIRFGENIKAYQYRGGLVAKLARYLHDYLQEITMRGVLNEYPKAPVMLITKTLRRLAYKPTKVLTKGNIVFVCLDGLPQNELKAKS